VEKHTSIWCYVLKYVTYIAKVNASFVEVKISVLVCVSPFKFSQLLSFHEMCFFNIMPLDEYARLQKTQVTCNRFLTVCIPLHTARKRKMIIIAETMNVKYKINISRPACFYVFMMPYLKSIKIIIPKQNYEM
jgi:hypothetical protein